jgi:bifunctional pyridoxal-dependent enzyme with beta-cystathionase and maltose regulon repressor activities
VATKIRRVVQSAIGPNNFEPNPDEIESEPLEPISTVVRELTSPDGTILRVEVPVYPPFRLKEKAAQADGGR